MEKELMEIKAEIRDLYDIILDLSHGLLKINNKIDGMLMDGMNMTHTEPPISYELESDGDGLRTIKARGRPKREAPPTAQDLSVVAEMPRRVHLPPELENLPKPPELTQKQGIVERLLGKDASEKARLRAERMAQLEKELDELGKKK